MCSSVFGLFGVLATFAREILRRTACDRRKVLMAQEAFCSIFIDITRCAIKIHAKSKIYGLVEADDLVDFAVCYLLRRLLLLAFRSCRGPGTWH
jgi:hypothetical protein